jgi:hypothetical protein
MSMRIRNGALLAGLCAAVILPLASGCGDDELEPTPPPSSPLVGTWLAMSIEVPDGDAVADGMSLVATVGAAGTISLNITGDQLGLCNPGPDCTISGTWTTTSTTITIDSGAENAILTYSVSGDSMTWIGTFEGVQAAIIFNRLT